MESYKESFFGGIQMRHLRLQSPVNRPRRWGSFMALMLLFLLVCQADAAMDGVRTGLRLCVHTMIPALFPFMVISEWIVRGNVGEMLASCKPFRFLGRITGLSQSGVCAFVMGAFCGFPIGSRMAAAYYRRGRMSADEFAAVLCVCNLPSSAFLINVVGAQLFGSVTLGRWLCIIALTSAMIVTLGLRFLRRTDQKRQDIVSLTVSGIDKGGATLPEMLASAVKGMQHVCATVVLFSSVTSVVIGMLARLGISQSAHGRACLLGFLELSGGVCEAATAFAPAVAAVVCAVLIGWGGLSVHCQIFFECGGCPVRKTWFWFSRIAQAILCGGGMALLLMSGILDAKILTTSDAVTTVGSFPDHLLGRLWWSLSIGGALVSLGCATYHRRMKRRVYGRAKETRA